MIGERQTQRDRWEGGGRAEGARWETIAGGQNGRDVLPIFFAIMELSRYTGDTNLIVGVPNKGEPVMTLPTSRKRALGELWVQGSLFVFIVIFLGLMVFGLSGCLGTGGSTGDNNGAVYHKISASQAKEMMDDATAASTSFVILDVRTQSEYQQKHIPGAVLLPVTDIASQAAAQLPNKDQLIFVYCRTGGRSSTASHTLVDMGYTNVYDIGGINSWPYDTTSS